MSKQTKLIDRRQFNLSSTLNPRLISGVYYDMMFILVSVALAVSSFISTVSSKSTEPSSPPSILKMVYFSVSCFHYYFDHTRSNLILIRRPNGVLASKQFFQQYDNRQHVTQNKTCHETDLKVDIILELLHRTIRSK